MLKIFNSLGRKAEDFSPFQDKKVGIYACGPTVYDYAHIGHGRKYTNDDVIRRTLIYLGYDVKLVMNVTDVGHLVSDADEGEDKLEKGAKKHGKTVWEVAEFFTQQFIESINKLNILPPDHLTKATEHIPEQIEMIKKLFENGYAYDTTEAVYFDVSKFPDYYKLFGQKLEDKEVGVREEVKVDEEKRNPQDFVLWFKCVGKYKDHIMRWESPWGEGFPGWHIECSAMSTKYLGDQFDIHTGGEDHLSIHHPNEIAQTEGATGKKPFVKYWIHHAFLKVDNQKMSKSLGNFYTIQDIEEKGFSALDIRYLYLTAHYKKTLNFTFDALTASKNARLKLENYIREWAKESEKAKTPNFEVNEEYKTKFIETIEDDFNMPQALAIVWDLAKSNLPSFTKLGTVLDFDKVFGLNLEEKLTNPEDLEIPIEAKILLEERNIARLNKDWVKSDEIRDRLLSGFGIEVKDSKDGYQVSFVK